MQRAEKIHSDDAATDCDRPGAFDDRNCVAAARGYRSLLHRAAGAGLR